MASQQILILRSRNSEDRFFDASTPEALAAACVAILTERDKQGFYESPAKRREFLEEKGIGKLANMTDEEIKALPTAGLISQITMERERALLALEDITRDEEWYQQMREIVDGQDCSIEVFGRHPHVRREPIAWRVLQFEYGRENEYVRISHVETPPLLEREVS